MILNAQQIRAAVEAGEIGIDPFDEKQLQAATYDLRVGDQGATTSTKKLKSLKDDGYLLVNPGDFAVITVKEVITLGAQYTGRFGLRSKYANKGLLATTGPQVDPGFTGRLIIGLTNLTPTAVSIPHNDHVVSIEIHRLEQPTEKPYKGRYQGKMELGAEEIEMITEGTGMALSEVLTTLGSLSKNVATLSEQVGTMAAELRTQRYLVPVMLTIGLAVIAIIVALN